MKTTRCRPQNDTATITHARIDENAGTFRCHGDGSHKPRVSQRRFGNNAAGPDRGNQIIFADDAIAIFDEIDEKIENLRLERDRNIARAGFPALAVNI
jgi:hypothetical protein